MPTRESISDILSDRSLETLQEITSAEVALVDPEAVLGAYREITLYQTVSDSDVQLLAKLLMDVTSWSFCIKRCLSKPTAQFHLSGDFGNATLSIGMNCREWVLTTDSQRQGGYFDPVVNDVRGVLKRTFPRIASSDVRSMWRSGVLKRLRDSPSPVDVDAIDTVG